MYVNQPMFLPPEGSAQPPLHRSTRFDPHGALFCRTETTPFKSLVSQYWLLHRIAWDVQSQ